jgi:2-polyprenyl-3-methyl-5-hydroxy-6-metoxy-1,4-benzoquinol methylase
MATETAQSTSVAVDQEKAQAFLGQVFGDLTGLTNTALASIGDRLGLFKDLAAHGPATSSELAARTGTNERYVREWLGGMASAGYVAYNTENGRFALPAEHVPTLADEGGPSFLAGVQQEMLGTLVTLGRVMKAFRHGGGVAPTDFASDTWEGIERFTNGWFNNLLVQHWLPLMPDVEAKLTQGAEVADVGCGHGRALIKLAQAFPHSRFTGYDVVPQEIERARANAAEAGVADRVRFERRDVASGLPATYDVITTFDVVHDAANPVGLLEAIRRALKPDGIYVCVDINCSDKLEENLGLKGAFFHGCSVLLCMTMSLAEHGAGLGTLGLPEAKLHDLCAQVGFGAVRTVPIENPFNNLYEIRASVGGI